MWFTFGEIYFWRILKRTIVGCGRKTNCLLVSFRAIFTRQPHRQSIRSFWIAVDIGQGEVIVGVLGPLSPFPTEIGVKYIHGSGNPCVAESGEENCIGSIIL